MRYFFDVAHGAHVVVSHASATYVAVFHSRDSLHQPLTKSVGAAPILVVKSPDDIEKWAPLVGALARGAASLIGRGGAKGLSARAGRVAARKPPGSVPTPPSLKPTRGMSRRQAYSSAWDGKNAPPGTFEGKGNFRNVTKPNIGETPDKFGGFSPNMNTAFGATNQSFANPPGLFERGKVAVSDASNAASDKLLGAGQRVSDIGRAGEKGLLDAGQRVSDAVGAAGDVAVRGTQSAFDAGGRAIEGAKEAAGYAGNVAVRGTESALDAGGRAIEGARAGITDATGQIADAAGRGANLAGEGYNTYLKPGADKSIWRPGGQIVGDFMSGERGQGLANWAGETAGRISESPIGQIGRNITSQGDALREGAGKFTDKYKEGMVGVTATGGGGGSVADASAAKGAPDVTVTPEKSTQEDLGGGTVPDPVTAPPKAGTTPKLPVGQHTMDDWSPGGKHVRHNEPATHGDVAAGNARQNLAATGLMGMSVLGGRRAEARAKQEAESQRLMQERSQQGAETGGGQVAVR